MNMSAKPIIVVQGAQWGSEAKGMVAAALCERRNVDYAVRTGTVNAGHTVYKDGVKYVNQQLPTGWVNNGTNLVIGPGAYIHPDIFFAEVKMVRDAGFTGRIYVDNRAGLHLPVHTDRSRVSGRHHAIGATGKGCSEAIIDRIKLRGSGGMLFKEWFGAEGRADAGVTFQGGWGFTDTVNLLHGVYDRGCQILIEGTQGTLLDLYLGPYPYTTHKQCIAAQWITEAGLSPSMEYEIVLVARTYPIRVAGNSGPMPGEIDWPTLALEIDHKLHLANKPYLVHENAIKYFMDEYDNQGKYSYSSIHAELSERNADTWRKCPPDVQQELSKLFEFTTVTKKLRRVARLDIDLLKHAVQVNRPSWIALTFLNYEFPELWFNAEHRLHAKHFDYMTKIQDAVGAPIYGYSTGPESKHLLTHSLARGR